VVSLLVKEENLSIEELKALIQEIENDKNTLECPRFLFTSSNQQ
jgi:uncharacterized protein YqfB (UPF0267 family)